MTSMASMPVYMMPGVPIVQPPHLEGDPNLATEILPGPPSLVTGQLSTAHKRDLKKSAGSFSYLPTSDPGTTYSGLLAGTLITQEVEGPRTKRARVDKSAASGRAQRASARHQNGAASAPDPPAVAEIPIEPATRPISIDSDLVTMVVDDEPSISRSNSSQNVNEGSFTGSVGRPRGTRRDKGKGKEIDTPTVRVKEEPKTVSLLSPEPPLSLVNEDHCSSCRSMGALVYCDGCPRAFHFWCLDPPMEAVDLPEGDSRWFCPSCMIRKNPPHPPQKPTASLMSPLLYQLQINIPTEFQLPEDIRTFFKDVATGPRGSYVDSSELKQPRLNRHGQLEDRDAHRLRDRNGAPVLCFRCGTSALPASVAAAAPAMKRARGSTSTMPASDTWKSLVSCDYCNLHWHLDCLDPPLSTMPSFGKKWMCPNHADQILHPKRRIPKQNAPPIEITKPRQFNNGNIEIIHPETTSTSQTKVAVDEVLINGRRYRVPERVIVLDFWNKVSKHPEEKDLDSDTGSGMSSPLTSLSSLDDLDVPPIPGPSDFDADDLRLAQMNRTDTSTPSVNGTGPHVSDLNIQKQHPASRPVRIIPRKSVKVAKKDVPTANGNTMDSGSTQPKLSISTAKRKKPVHNVVQPEQSTRELRSRSKNNEGTSNSISAKTSGRRTDDADGLWTYLSAPPPRSLGFSGNTRSGHVKLEESEHNPEHTEPSLSDELPYMPPPAKVLSGKRTRNVRRPSQQQEIETLAEPRPRRIRKRKERDDEMPDTEEGGEAIEKNAKSKDRSETDKREKEKQTNQSSTRHDRVATTASTTPSVAPPSTLTTATTSSTPATPSLKIRLPRLGGMNLQNASSPAKSARTINVAVNTSTHS